LTEISSKNYYKNWRFLIAPHEIDEKSIQQIETLSPNATYRFSEIKSPILYEEEAILILNTIGQLSTAYQYADAVFIGGGFDKSIHNILEPAVFGIPITFGPNYHRFIEAVELVNLKGAVPIQSAKDLIVWFERLQIAAYRMEKGIVCRDYTKKNRGATQEVINYLNKKYVLKLI
ncbi:MAG: 3-deoxy-D-manno-octulosonic acid transferase, partial [Saprospiraceae bacterium]